MRLRNIRGSREVIGASDFVIMSQKSAVAPGGRSLETKTPFI